MMFRKITKIQVLIYLISLIQQPLSADSSFVLSITEFKTKILRALSRNAETKDFARLTSHPVRG